MHCIAVRAVSAITAASLALTSLPAQLRAGETQQSPPMVRGNAADIDAAGALRAFGASPATGSPPAAAPTALSRADYEACQTTDEPTFRKAIETITSKAQIGRAHV